MRAIVAGFIGWCLLFAVGQIQAQTAEGEPILSLETSEEGGFYLTAIEVELYSDPGANIYYTLDGSAPSRRSPIYRKAIYIAESTVLRAVAYRGQEKSTPIGQTYFIDEPESNLPTVSIAVAPEILFDGHTGLFVKGNNTIDSIWRKPGANFWSRKEVPIYLEMYETDGNSFYSNGAGFRLFGGMSRLFPQKSMALVARKRYGQSRFKHQIFGKDGPRRFKFLVLRNSGSDFGKSHIRDGIMTGLMDETDTDYQRFRSANVYINGRYWGIYNIREKINRYFLSTHHDVDKDSLDLLEHRWTRKRGSRRDYMKLLRFVETKDLSDPANYAYLKNWMDIDNFIDFQIAQVYFDNQDAGGNIRFWRPKKEGGKWRWILYDTDWGMGLHQSDAYKNNSLAFHTDPNGPAWPNPPWSTLFLRKLLTNAEFEQAFLTRICDHTNATFAPERVIGRINAQETLLGRDMPRHLSRWRRSEKMWHAHLDRMRTFAEERPFHLRLHLMDQFATGEKRTLISGVDGGGHLLLNDHIKIEGPHWEGVYFEHLPVTLRAIPHAGYRFSHWEAMDVEQNVREITLKLPRRRTRIRAVFEPYEHPLAGELVINEVCPRGGKAGDWVELHNQKNKTVNLSGWVLADRNNEFVLPDGTLIGPNDYLVICQDSIRFKEKYPTSYNLVSGLPYGLHKRKETIQLFSEDGAAVDSLSYLIPPLDTSFSLSLLLPWLKNEDTENWAVRLGPGSPNKPNPYYLESRVRNNQQRWMQIGLTAGVFLLALLLLFLRARGRI